jgi:hypothetical protein
MTTIGDIIITIIGHTIIEEMTDGMDGITDLHQNKNYLFHL